jgi:hypothetical protein
MSWRLHVVSSSFDTITVGTDITTSVIETIRKWMPTYLQEIELQLGRERGLIPPPRFYTTRNKFMSYPEEQLPLCVVVSPGLTDAPTKDGDGCYNGWYGVGVGFVAQARDDVTADFLAKVYAADARAILLQHQDMGGGTAGTEWIDEIYDDDIAEDENRTLKASYVLFRIYVENIVNSYGGPVGPIPNPDTQPGSDWGTVETVETEVVIERG